MNFVALKKLLCSPPIIISLCLFAVLSYSAFSPPIAFLRSFMKNPSLAPIAMVFYFIALAILLFIAIIDAREMQIFDIANIALALCGLILAFAGLSPPILSRLLAAAIIGLPLIFVAIFFGNAFGLGDAFLLTAAALLLGLIGAILAIFIGSLLGGAYAVFLLITKRKTLKDRFPFAPPLCIGIGISMFIALPLFS